MDESKLWLLRREDIVGKEEGPWEDGVTGDARHGILGTLGMLGARIRLGMLLRSLSMQHHQHFVSIFMLYALFSTITNEKKIHKIS